MGWRLAGSLGTLENEVRAAYPGMTFGTIADDNHTGATDHKPNAAGVVCALDIMCGLNVPLAQAIAASGHPDIKYVIHNRKIWSKSRAAEGWRAYSGSNPHTDHIHVSVGVGSDGKSAPPYDDTVSWGIHTTEGINMFCKHGDQNDNVKAMQRVVMKAGGSLPQFGADGDYGDETASALASIVGGDGMVYGPDQYAALLAALVVKVAPAAALVPHVHAATVGSFSVGPAKSE